MLQPPEWFKAFIYCEAFLQMPFFPVAAYAFFKGRYETSVRRCPGQRFCVTLAFSTAEKVYRPQAVTGPYPRSAGLFSQKVLCEKAAQNEACQKRDP